jgi:hypothetical protein
MRSRDPGFAHALADPTTRLVEQIQALIPTAEPGPEAAPSHSADRESSAAHRLSAGFVAARNTLAGCTNPRRSDESGTSGARDWRESGTAKFDACPKARSVRLSSFRSAATCGLGLPSREAYSVAASHSRFRLAGFEPRRAAFVKSVLFSKAASSIVGIARSLTREPILVPPRRYVKLFPLRINYCIISSYKFRYNSGNNRIPRFEPSSKAGPSYRFVTIAIHIFS